MGPRWRAMIADTGNPEIFGGVGLFDRTLLTVDDVPCIGCAVRNSETAQKE
jgi:hypothetical protein